MAATEDEGSVHRGARRSQAEWTAIACALFAAFLAIPYAVIGLIFLTTDVSCGTDVSWTDPMIPLGLLGGIGATVGVVAGVWVWIQGRLVGLALSLANAGVIALGLAILVLDFEHVPLEFC
jgi:hypothetical protein